MSIPCPFCKADLRDHIRSLWGTYLSMFPKKRSAGRFSNLTPEERSAAAREAINKRWAKKKEQNPDAKS